MAKLPSPCVDVCKFKRGGHCIGCAMTKKQKKDFKALDGGKPQKRFLTDLLAEQRRLGGYDGWLASYRRKCKKKGVACPLP